MSKKATAPTRAEVPARSEPTLSDWFDRWPDLFARRWPESLQGIPFFEDRFRMEQYVEDDGTLVVRGELPGMDPDEDVTITAGNGRLTISAKRENRTEVSENGRFRSEFHYGSFERSVPLPTGARPDDVSATYTDGILEVRVPVDAETEAVKKIPVERLSTPNDK